MLRIGIVGAENSHCRNIAKLCNVEKAVGDARVVTVWGERPKFAKDAATVGQIPSIVRDWRDMLGSVDGVMIDHRHAKYHAEVATFFVNHDIPCFVDKPFTYTLAEGKRLCRLARQRGVPIVSFSTRIFQESFKQYQQEQEKAGAVSFFNSTGPVDLDSKHGGIFFYGIHQVDPVIELYGTDVATAELRRQGKNGLATLTYRQGPVVTINCVGIGCGEFHASAVAEKTILDWNFVSDSGGHLAGAQLFTQMFRTGHEPVSHARMLAPIAVLESLAKSLAVGKPIAVPKLKLD